jgi:hypothetical protein
VAVKFLQMMITSAPHQQFVFHQKLLVCSFSFLSAGIESARAHLVCDRYNKEKEINFHEQLGIIVILGAGGAAEKKHKKESRCSLTWHTLHEFSDEK